jgi:hypothetical protein
MRRGLLLTLTEPPAGMEEEFNAWYDTEHIPECLAIAGFRSARRWVHARTYLATYELDSLAVLSSSSSAYLARYENPTPWSRRCLGKCVSFRRCARGQIEPGEADPNGATRGLVQSSARLVLDDVLQELTLYELSDDKEQPSAIVYRLYPS